MQWRATESETRYPEVVRFARSVLTRQSSRSMPSFYGSSETLGNGNGWTHCNRARVMFLNNHKRVCFLIVLILLHTFSNVLFDDVPSRNPLVESCSFLTSFFLVQFSNHDIELVTLFFENLDFDYFYHPACLRGSCLCDNVNASQEREPIQKTIVLYSLRVSSYEIMYWNRTYKGNGRKFYWPHTIHNICSSQTLKS